MCINGLEETQDDPDVHGDEVQVTSDRDPENRRADDANTQQHNLDRGGVLSRKAKWCRIGVVQLVDCAVKRTVVQRAVEPVMPCVFHDEEDGDLHSNSPGRRERNTKVHAKICCDGVEQPNLRELDSKMTQ